MSKKLREIIPQRKVVISRKNTQPVEPEKTETKKESVQKMYELLNEAQYVIANFRNLQKDATEMGYYRQKANTSDNREVKTFTEIEKNMIENLFFELFEETRTYAKNTVKCFEEKNFTGYEKNGQIMRILKNNIDVLYDATHIYFDSLDQSEAKRRQTFGKSLEIIGNSYSILKNNFNVKVNSIHHCEVLKSENEFTKSNYVGSKEKTK